MRFTIDPELELFAGSVRGAIGDWEPPLEPAFGRWQDDRDDDLAARLAAVGFGELWSDPALLGPAVAGGIELGRAIAPLCLVDDATLGGPLALDGRVRHGEGRVEGGEREPTLDGTGTLRGVTAIAAPEPQRLPLWGAVTLAYLAGLADGALRKAVAHTRSREQFGEPLAALPAVQGHLADAALARDGIVLCAWAAAVPDATFPAATLASGGAACREVTAHVQQVHGGVGFALEGGIHRYYRRAKSVQVWVDALLRQPA